MSGHSGIWNVPVCRIAGKTSLASLLSQPAGPSRRHPPSDGVQVRAARSELAEFRSRGVDTQVYGRGMLAIGRGPKPIRKVRGAMPSFGRYDAENWCMERSLRARDWPLFRRVGVGPARPPKAFFTIPDRTSKICFERRGRGWGVSGIGREFFSIALRYAR